MNTDAAIPRDGSRTRLGAVNRNCLKEKVGASCSSTSVVCDPFRVVCPAIHEGLIFFIRHGVGGKFVDSDSLVAVIAINTDDTLANYGLLLFMKFVGLLLVPDVECAPLFLERVILYSTH